NQLGIKEKEMLKEYTDLLKKQKEDQNLKFGELKNQNEQEKEMLKEYTDLLKKQKEDQNLKFGELKNQNQQIINWINSTGIELHNDLLNRKNQQNPLQPNNNQTNPS
ncbi:MAG: hypothetical protein K0U66_07290, partial [Gammaproteobacteria bacterium]|nr:hypothetical protein [Gammaproteobacteria bacterium]